MYGRAWGKAEEISPEKCIEISVVSRKTPALGIRKNKRLAIYFPCSALNLCVELNALLQIVVFIIADVFLTFLDFL